MGNPRKILIIRRDNIGDLVCTTPAFAALRERYPDAEIAALVNSYNADVLRGNPNIDYVFVYQKLKHARGLGGRFRALIQRVKLVARIRRWKPDVTVLAKASYDRHGLGFARQIGATSIIGYVPKIQGEAKDLPDIRLETPAFAVVHEVQAMAGLLIPLGIEQPMGPLQVFPEINAVVEVKSRLPYAPHRIALHISAREPERRWGIDNFIALIQHILKTKIDTQILLFWSPGKANDPYHPGDDDAAQELIRVVCDERVVPMPTKNLTELIAALSLCELFIGTDGGAMHLAVALNKRILAMFENKTDKLSHWYPWQVTNELVHSLDKARPNVEGIGTEQLYIALDRLI